MQLEQRFGWSLVLFLGVGVVLLLTTGCDRKPTTAGAKAPPPLVRVARVKQEAIPVFMDFSGTVKSMKTGVGIVAAAATAARIRLRPILMTAFAFVFGLMPLVLATGAGANARRSLGTTVVGGLAIAIFA